MNFEKLTEWHKEAAVDPSKYRRVMKKKPGVLEEPADVHHPGELFEHSFACEHPR
jgi:hypothetical protein